ncbi:heme NO-binding domain-containing protein [Cerasicoccus maritimus]|uniref:heme NO-binding domain-containing protein n=1 Tax=Cerasicoccus maritimus TaxID=490089 RepID=UPI0028524BE6|nr:heme NO-binding domain-containing protein [Cerasicoccus maritimus]
MKGMVFTELLDMVEDKFGIDMVDSILDEADLPVSHGAYTAVGTYPHEEIVSIVMQLSKQSSLPPEELLKIFGEHLFTRFHQLYPQFFEDSKCAFDFLQNIDQYIHVEVRKLYPDAELPDFDCRQIGNEMIMTYTSSRHMEPFAEGLIRGCLKHYQETAQICCESNGENSSIFTISLQ